MAGLLRRVGRCTPCSVGAYRSNYLHSEPVGLVLVQQDLIKAWDGRLGLAQVLED